MYTFAFMSSSQMTLVRRERSGRIEGVTLMGAYAHVLILHRTVYLLTLSWSSVLRNQFFQVFPLAERKNVEKYQRNYRQVMS